MKNNDEIKPRVDRDKNLWVGKQGMSVGDYKGKFQQYVQSDVHISSTANSMKNYQFSEIIKGRSRGSYSHLFQQYILVEMYILICIGKQYETDFCRDHKGKEAGGPQGRGEKLDRGGTVQKKTIKKNKSGSRVKNSAEKEKQEKGKWLKGKGEGGGIDT